MNEIVHSTNEGGSLLENGMTFEDLLAEVEAQHDQIQEGQLVKGTVVAIKGDHVLVDVGYKSEGAIPLYEFRNEEKRLTASAPK